MEQMWKVNVQVPIKLLKGYHVNLGIVSEKPKRIHKVMESIVCIVFFSSWLRY